MDTSVVLAALLAEDRRPPVSFWNGRLVSSRLLEYETWTRLHALRASDAVTDAAQLVLGSVDLAEMTPFVLGRALEPFPSPVRTLDALHLATASYLVAQGLKLQIATYDAKLAAGARALGMAVVEP